MKSLLERAYDDLYKYIHKTQDFADSQLITPEAMAKRAMLTVYIGLCARVHDERKCACAPDCPTGNDNPEGQYLAMHWTMDDFVPLCKTCFDDTRYLEVEAAKELVEFEGAITARATTLARIGASDGTEGLEEWKATQ